MPLLVREVSLLKWHVILPKLSHILFCSQVEHRLKSNSPLFGYFGYLTCEHSFEEQLPNVCLNLRLYSWICDSSQTNSWHTSITHVHFISKILKIVWHLFICLTLNHANPAGPINASEAKKNPDLNICLSVTLARFFLFAIHKRMERPNLIKLCTKLADITKINIGLLAFQFITVSIWRPSVWRHC